MMTMMGMREGPRERERDRQTDREREREIERDKRERRQRKVREPFFFIQESYIKVFFECFLPLH